MFCSQITKKGVFLQHFNFILIQQRLLQRFITLTKHKSQSNEIPHGPITQAPSHWLPN